MCFYTGKSTKNAPKPKIAEEDIVCYKDLGSNNSPFFQKLIIDGKEERGYKKGYIYTDSFGLQKGIVNWQIYSGFHSYKNKNFGNAEFVIPKGAQYYENDNEYCSNQIQFIKRY